MTLTFQLGFWNTVRGDMYTLNKPSIHWNPPKPTWKWLTTHEERIGENTFKQRENCENSSSCTKYIVTSVHIWKNHKKKTIKTMYAFCYTERHSVWYVVYYCEHIFTDICYRFERKGQLRLQMAILSCTFLTLHMVQEVLCHWSEETTVPGSSKVGINKSIPRLFNEIQAPLPCIRWRTMQTQEVNRILKPDKL